MNTRVRSWLAGLCLLLSVPATGSCAAPPEAIPLWPKSAPGDVELPDTEKDLTKPTDDFVAGKRLIRLGNVLQPTLTVYRPPREKDTGAAVVVCPGGGYHILALDLEGTEVTTWLNSIGVTGILLKYRVPIRPNQERHHAALQDAQRALGLARHHAKDWGIDPQRLGIMGFSAGAHLSAALSCNYEERAYAPIDDADRLSCRPDFTLLIYPAYLTLEKESDKIAPELKITPKTPPTFLIQTEDDGVRVECSLYYYLALKNAKVPVEMHLYPTGGHGYGLRPTPQTVTTWPERAEPWLRGLGVLERKP